jgi:alpha-L-fucosidase
MTMNNTWGFNQYDTNWKSAETLIRNVIDCASKGGNYLLNVGPTGLGEIPDASIERLAVVGRWMKQNGDAIYGTQAGPFPRPLPWGRVTRKGQRMFLHVFEAGATKIDLTGLKTKVRRVYPIGEPSKSLPYSTTESGITVNLPKTSALVPVYVLEFGGEPIATPPTLVPNAKGILDLPAGAAETTGGIQYESNSQALGFWTHVGDTASWAVEIKKWAPVRVSITLACEKGYEGSTYAVDVAGQTVSGRVPYTGGWGKFTTITLGTVTLKPGRTRVVVRPIKMPAGAVMNLRRVVIEP